MKLYQFDLSPTAKRVRIVANEVGERLTVVSLDMMQGEHLTPEYGAKNPNRLVPTLELDDGTSLWESTAICTYLAERHPERNLIPVDARARAEVTKWIGWNASHLEAALFTILVEKMFARQKLGRDPSELKVNEAQKAVDRFAPVLNAQLESHPYVAGASFTIADVCIATSIEVMTLLNMFDVTPYRHIAAWLSRVQAREAWRAASAS